MNRSKIRKILIFLLIGIVILYFITGEIAVLLLVAITLVIGGTIMGMKRDPNSQREWKERGFGDKDKRDPMGDKKVTRKNKKS